MNYNKLHIKLLLLLIKEDIKSIIIGVLAVYPYLSWIFKPLLKITLHTFILILFVFGPLCIWMLVIFIFYDFFRCFF